MPSLVSKSIEPEASSTARMLEGTVSTCHWRRAPTTSSAVGAASSSTVPTPEPPAIGAAVPRRNPCFAASASPGPLR